MFLLISITGTAVTVFITSPLILGRLIDFGLAEPAKKWKNRAEALAKYREKRILRRKSLSKNSPDDDCKRGVGGSTSAGESNLQLIRKVERGGTTGFRAPEVLWHSRDQVGYDMKGVMIQCVMWW